MKKPSEMSKAEINEKIDGLHAAIKPQLDLIISESRAEIVFGFMEDHAKQDGGELVIDLQEAVDSFKSEILDGCDEIVAFDFIKYAGLSRLAKASKFHTFLSGNEGHDLLLNKLLVASGSGDDQFIADFLLLAILGYSERSTSLKPL